MVIEHFSGKIEPPTKRFDRLIKKIRSEHPSANVDITTHNTFPTAAGLASSASGYAALASALKLLYPTRGVVSELARLGSGSACRSTAGGFVLWEKGEEEGGGDSVARQLFSADHWPEIRILVCVVCREEKAVPSTAGMQATVVTSNLMPRRVTHVQERIQQITAAIQQRDFAKFGEITMRDSNEMHAVCLDTFPPIAYLNDTSHLIIRSVHSFNSDKGAVRAAYTFDAGPNAVLLCEERDFVELRERIRGEFCGEKGKVTELVECEIGCGPLVLTD